MADNQTLTQAQFNRLLSASSPEEMRRIAEEIGFDLDRPYTDWGFTPSSDLITPENPQQGPLPNVLAQIQDHYNQLTGDPGANAIDQALAGADIDGDGRVSTSELDAAADAAGEIDPAAAEEVRERSDPSWNAPRWILDSFNAGVNLTPAQQERILRDINFEYGQRFGSWDELMSSPILTNPDGNVQELVQYAILDQEPIEAFKVNYGAGKSFAIEADEFALAQETYGVDQRDLMHMVRLADRVGLSNRDGDRPSWQVALALAKATNMIGQLTSRVVPNKPPLDFMDAIEAQEAANAAGQPMSGTIGAPGEPVYTGNVDDASFTTADRFQNLSSNILRGEANQGTNLGPRRETLSFRDLGQRFNEGLEKYNYDPLVAFLYSVDDGLAARLAYSKGDITKLKGKDVYLARGILSDAGFAGFGQFQQTMMQMGYGEAEGAGFENLWNYFAAIDEQQRQTQGDGPAGPSGPTVKYPDPAGLDETIRSLYQQLFFEEPDDATLANFRSQIKAAVDTAFESDISSVDISARARQFLRDSPQYEEFYSNKPEGLSEEEYAAQMQYAQGSILGNELAGNKAVREGLRTGKYQTAVGAAAGTAEAWDSSTFLGRLARAGEVVGRNT